jgi:acetyl-CoA carboxylase biotin carboxyl carrier protein
MALKKTTGSRDDQPEDELNLIRTLAGILDETGLTEIEIERDGSRVRVARTPTANIHHTPQPAAPHPPTFAGSAAAASETTARAADVHNHPGAVKSPMVGTIYRSPSPGASAYVEIGSEVKQGQTLLIIEAMKTMNQIPAPRAGKVTQIFVESGHAVEYGETLVIIE